MSPARIESADQSDVEALVPLMRAYCDFYESDPPDEGLVRMAKALIACPDDEGMLLVARGEDGAPVGFAAVGWKWSSLRGARVAVLEDLFVDPGSRGAGIAGELIAECGRRAKAGGAPAMLWVTATDNERAQAAYARTGATGETWLEYELELDGPDG
jgi:GNAT superfamily N-acetyltransferase